MRAQLRRYTDLKYTCVGLKYQWLLYTELLRKTVEARDKNKASIEFFKRNLFASLSST